MSKYDLPITNFDIQTYVTAQCRYLSQPVIPMNVSLTPELEKFVQSKVKSGRYLSASEVIREALRLLEERDRLYQARLADLQKEITLGVESAARGDLYDGQTVIQELLADNQKRVVQASLNE
jgi:antitoxin ParD1/3/4